MSGVTNEGDAGDDPMRPAREQSQHPAGFAPGTWFAEDLASHTNDGVCCKDYSIRGDIGHDGTGLLQCESDRIGGPSLP